MGGVWNGAMQRCVEDSCEQVICSWNASDIPQETTPCIIECATKSRLPIDHEVSVAARGTAGVQEIAGSDNLALMYRTRSTIIAPHSTAHTEFHISHASSSSHKVRHLVPRMLDWSAACGIRATYARRARG